MSLNDFFNGKEVKTENGSLAKVTRKTSTKVFGDVNHGGISVSTVWDYSGMNLEFPGWHILSRNDAAVEEEEEACLCSETSTPTPAQPYIISASVTRKVESIDSTEDYSKKLISVMKETKLNQLKDSLKWFMDNDIGYLVNNLPLSTDEQSIEVSYQSTSNKFDSSRRLVIELEELYILEEE